MPVEFSFFSFLITWIIHGRHHQDAEKFFWTSSSLRTRTRTRPKPCNQAKDSDCALDLLNSLGFQSPRSNHPSLNTHSSHLHHGLPLSRRSSSAGAIFSHPCAPTSPAQHPSPSSHHTPPLPHPAHHHSHTHPTIPYLHHPGHTIPSQPTPSLSQLPRTAHPRKPQAATLRIFLHFLLFLLFPLLPSIPHPPRQQTPQTFIRRNHLIDALPPLSLSALPLPLAPPSPRLAVVAATASTTACPSSALGPRPPAALRFRRPGKRAAGARSTAGCGGAKGRGRRKGRARRAAVRARLVGWGC